MKTWGDMKSEIKRECNIEAEDFASDAELLVWGNEAKKQAEKEIVSLYDKYLETEAPLALVNGTELYAPPADIMANKITSIHYDSGSEAYEIKLIKRKNQILYVNENDDYRFRMVNVAGTGARIKLYPASRETSASNVTVFYIRESAAIDADEDTMDIPIADDFIKQFIKDKIKEKEIGPMNYNQESTALRQERKLMIEALNQMIPSDDAEEIDMEPGIYEEFECGYEW